MKTETAEDIEELIVTQWDVNADEPHIYTVKSGELIVTQWDVNSLFYCINIKDSKN